MSEYKVNMALFILLTVLVTTYVDGRDLTPMAINSVYDGDTFKVDLRCSTSVLCNDISIRVKGIDTPEFRGSGSNEKTLAHMAKEVTYDFLHNNSVVLKNCIRGKYFRLVCDVESKDRSLGELLIDRHLAVEYNGGTKTKDWSRHEIKEIR